ncbi:hypothetical protein COE40_19010 [Bacillus cereus]|nr:hypothetical protein COE40_19010 [Bacillus cereus]
MTIDIEMLQKALKKFYEACQTIVQWIRQTWDQIKKLAWVYKEYKKRRKCRAVFGYVKDKVMKSQVLNRKPMLIRARNTC